MSAPTGRVYRALTSLRFFAAISVVCFHYLGETTGYAPLPASIKNLVMCAPAALCFFFLLSGFVLAASYGQRYLHDAKARIYFWIGRFARLYPAYLLAFLLFLPMAVEKYLRHPAALSLPEAHVAFLAGGGLSLFMLQAWTPFSQTWNGPSWSLSVEAFFYFAFPFIIRPLQKMRLRYAVLLSLVLWMPSLTIAVARAFGHFSPPVFLTWVQFQPLFWFPAFVMGIVLFRLEPRWQSVSTPVANLVVVATSATFVALCAFAPLPYSSLIVTVGVLPLLALLVLAFSHAKSGLVQALGVEPLYTLGEISYCTYIIQAPSWHIYAAVVNKLRGTGLTALLPTWYFGLFVLLLLALSYIVHRWIEMPTRAWILRKTMPPKASRAVPSPQPVLRDAGID